MTTIKTPVFWDENFLKARARDQQASEARAQHEEDWAAAQLQFDRETSDVLCLFRGCRLVVCRRARRCIGAAMPCFDRSRPTFPPGIEQSLIEEIYAGIQEDRRSVSQE